MIFVTVSKVDYVERAGEGFSDELRPYFQAYVKINQGLDMRLRQDPGFLERKENSLLRRTVTDYLMTRSSSYMDPLTGLYNLGYFNDQMPNLFSRARLDTLAGARRDYEKTGKGLSLVLLDMIGLKHFNDTVSRSEGDRRLVALADVLKHVYRAYDVKARLGGDDFAIAQPEANREEAFSSLRRLEKALQEVGAEPKIEIHTGIGSYSNGMTNYQQIIDLADEELKARKARSKHPLARA